MDQIYILAKHVSQYEYIDPETGHHADDDVEFIAAFADKQNARLACSAKQKEAQENPWIYDDPDKSDPRYWEILTTPLLRTTITDKQQIHPRWSKHQIDEAYISLPIVYLLNTLLFP